MLPRSILRPVEANFTMVISTSTMLQQKDDCECDFPARVYNLPLFADLPVPSETPERPLDVIGKASAVSDVSVLTVPGRIQSLARRDIILSNPRLGTDD